MPEHRKEPRHRTLKAARIAFSDHRSVIDCLVRNLSDHGACLNIETTLGIPDSFDLILADDRSVRACRVMWRNDKQIGVEFR
jgi:hypothetical protein